MGYILCDQSIVEQKYNPFWFNFRQFMTKVKLKHKTTDESSDDYRLLMALYIDCNQLMDDLQPQHHWFDMNSLTKMHQFIDQSEEQVVRRKKTRKNRFSGVLTK
ncbi:unnamed protein product [Medioppia subpectinata]|uniref:Uncharacterized protein n=1 Tax=Medioppia subpectinata TaxID=1979941 RepID=A0A7R9Q4W6_9ACAR|nr:unnamed protein product [Medioppia subpectinata]CAG2112140.1 unnamed protein product [Medioppia subpectinata]